VIATGVDPARLIIRTLLNGRERQNYPVSDMIFSPAEIVGRLSQDMTLEPGDVVACGTSLGVAPMRPGAAVEVAIDGVGILRNVYGQEGDQA
jgi:2-keto-4-pentenoate hydratase/2-oxohepta-3-ene-1,7-dioic acid hydratase in catechol pathway